LRTVRPTNQQCAQGGLSLKEIAGMMDLTKERVRQIEARALLKLSINLASKKIAPADLLGEIL